jgi:hypothetical protein
MLPGGVDVGATGGMARPPASTGLRRKTGPAQSFRCNSLQVPQGAELHDSNSGHGVLDLQLTINSPRLLTLPHPLQRPRIQLVPQLLGSFLGPAQPPWLVTGFWLLNSCQGWIALQFPFHHPAFNVPSVSRDRSVAE